MTRLVVDVENSVVRNGRATDGRSQNPSNSLVSIGICDVDTGETDYLAVYHKERQDPADKFDAFKKRIESAKLLVGHNIKYDLQWLWSVGIDYRGDVHDTMIGEYILARGERMSISLKNSCERRDLQHKKSDIAESYWDKGIGYEAMPWSIVEEYGRADVEATRDLYLEQLGDYIGSPLQRTLELTNKMCVCLAEIEYAGMKIDTDVLNQVEFDFRREKAAVQRRLDEMVYHVMGDRPFNLSSPEQLSQILFSRAPRSKDEHYKFFQLDRWFKPRVPPTKFKQYLKTGCEPVYRTTGIHCVTCDGKGKIHKLRKDGTPYKNAMTCKDCGGAGTRYVQTRDIAGFKINPPDYQWATAGGFSTDKTKLRILVKQLKAKIAGKSNAKVEEAIEFIEKVERLGALETYLSSFVEGVRKRLLGNILYAEFNQCRTATGRLSSSSPNLQNMPRGGTFPVKKAFVSRFDEGVLLEFDFAQLEFRAAAFLADDARAKHEIETGFDVHTYTADYLTEQGQPTSRQEAKSRTFAPLYGSVSGTPAERAYNLHFVQKYEGIRRWHQELQDSAIRQGMIRLPSGREFKFPNTKRTASGGATNATKIKNYPVQSFATADLVPLCLVNLRNEIKRLGLSALIVNTVHDSVLLDCPKDEVEKVEDILGRVLSTSSIDKMISDFYDISMTVPLEIEHKVGRNWMEMI